jgi:hypothetical protein
MSTSGPRSRWPHGPNRAPGIRSYLGFARTLGGEHARRRDREFFVHHQFHGSEQQLGLVERFTPVSREAIHHESTVVDATF